MAFVQRYPLTGVLGPMLAKPSLFGRRRGRPGEFVLANARQVAGVGKRKPSLSI